MKNYYLLSLFIIVLIISCRSYAQLDKQVYATESHNGMLKVLTEYHDTPIILDWPKFIPKEYADIQSGKVPKHFAKEFEKRRDQYGYAEFSFKAPLTDELKKKHYYLISEHGIDSVEMTHIGVTVQYALEDKSLVVKYANYTGYLIVNAKWNDYPGYVLISDEVQKLKVNKLTFAIDEVGEDDPEFPKLMNHAGVKEKKAFSVGHKRKDSIFAFISIEKESEKKCGFIGLFVVYDQRMPMIAQWNYAKCTS